MSEMLGIQCPVCKMYHPPPACETYSDDVNISDVNAFVTNIKTIITSQLGMKKIEDQKKFFNVLTVELTKFMEDYRE